jgi:hypothetical protein
VSRRVRRDVCALLVILVAGVIGLLVDVGDWLIRVGELEIEDPRGPV